MGNKLLCRGKHPPGDLLIPVHRLTMGCKDSHLAGDDLRFNKKTIWFCRSGTGDSFLQYTNTSSPYLSQTLNHFEGEDIAGKVSKRFVKTGEGNPIMG